MSNLNNDSIHTGIYVNKYILMHKNDVVGIASSENNSFDILIPEKMPFKLRDNNLSYTRFYEWMFQRANNLQRTYMNKVYIARKIGRDLDSIIKDSCLMSITDKFWINRSDINTTWDKLQERRDNNITIAEVALTGNLDKLNFKEAAEGTLSLFATKGYFPKAILSNCMLKQGGMSKSEWIASLLGNALGIPVQKAEMENPSMGGYRNNEGYLITHIPNEFIEAADDTRIKIELFTSENISLCHAADLFFDNIWNSSVSNGFHHLCFYERLPTEGLKRDYEKICILNWLLGNQDMHTENYGLLYDNNTFKIINVSPSYDHNSSTYNAMPSDLDVPIIIKKSIHHHSDIVDKIESGHVNKILDTLKGWLSDNQKQGVQAAAYFLVCYFKDHNFDISSIKAMENPYIDKEHLVNWQESYSRWEKDNQDLLNKVMSNYNQTFQY